MATDTPPPPSNPKPIPPLIATAPPPTTAIKPPPAAVKLRIRDPNLRPYIPKSAHKKRLQTTAPNPTRTCCTCCCCLTWFIITLLLLSIALGAAFGVFWILYRPQMPKFTIASLKISNLTLTGNIDTDASGRLYTSGNLTISAKNPNSKITALYDVVTMSVCSSNNRSSSSSSSSYVVIANSTFQPFKSAPGNSTVMRFVFKNWRTLDLDAARELRSELMMGKRGSMIGARMELETTMGVQIGKWKSKRIGIRVVCFGLRVRVPIAGKKNGSSWADGGVSDEGKCEVHLSNKIWGFTF